MDDTISRQAAIDAADKIIERDTSGSNAVVNAMIAWSEYIRALPSAQPEIIRCKDCKHWTQSTGKMTGYGLGRCDFHDADLVACNGFCYWAERRAGRQE
jgi:hypothetical protein